MRIQNKNNKKMCENEKKMKQKFRLQKNEQAKKDSRKMNRPKNVSSKNAQK